ncbi:MAG: acetate--CoA ligase family protein [Candidatus Peribacteraceae bacterium]
MITLHPKTVALIGASDNPEKLGHRILMNLKNGGFTGDLFPVNPTHDTIEGIACYKDIKDIKKPLDLAVVVTPAKTVPAIAEACGKKKVKCLVVISAGFSETGSDEGKKAESSLREIGDKYKMTVIGPNCLGILLPHIGLNASFALTPKEKGSIALISQSGAMAVALLDKGDELKLGCSAVFSTGNKAHTDEAVLIDLLKNDPHTRVIGLYVESIQNGEAFLRAAKSAGKPIVLLKAGVSMQGAKAVSSHTGALAGSTAALDAACSAAGVWRANDAREFILMLQALSTTRTLPSPSIGIITNAGGLGVLATDAVEKERLELPRLDKAVEKKLRTALPEAASTHNPIDVLGDAGVDRYEAALHAAASDPKIEGIVCLVTPQVMTPCAEIARAIVKVVATHPLLPVVTCFMGGDAVEEATSILREHRIPCADTPEQAVRMLAMLREKRVPLSEDADHPTDDDRSSVAHGLLKKKSGHVSDSVASELLALYGLRMPEQEIAKSAKDAGEIAEALGFPVVLKVSAKDILHKTEVGGVRVGIHTKREAEKAFAEIVKNCEKHAPTAGLDGVLVQKQMPAGSEFIVGALRDPSFGPIVMVGLGGIYTELFRDTAFRLAPVTEDSATEMLTTLRSWKLLTGLRGKGAMDIAELARVIAETSRLMSECEDITEIDLNPVLVDESGVVIADAKIVVR